MQTIKEGIAMEWFYDGQIRRYLTQLIRMLSNFYYKTGDGTLIKVPVMYGDMTRQVASIIRENSENKLPSVPRIAIYITNIELDKDRISDSSFVSKTHIRERAYDPIEKKYINKQGKNYTVERLMPTPYKLTVNADLWTSNTDQKLQLFEQISVLFSPSIEIQTTDNFVDWTSLTVVDLENIGFSSRSIPVGTESEIDILTFTLKTPIWISPPAKVKKMGIITNIITSIFNEDTGVIDLGLSMPELNAYDSSSAGRVDANPSKLANTATKYISSYTDTIDTSKTYRTRDGKDVRIYSDDGGTDKPVQGAYWDPQTNVWVMTSWSINGKFDTTSDSLNDLDIIIENIPASMSTTQVLNGATTTVGVNYGNFGVYLTNNVAKLVYNNSTKKENWWEVLTAHPGTYTPNVSRIFLTRLDLDISIVGTFVFNALNNSIINVAWDTDSFPSDTIIEGRTSIDYVINPKRFNPSIIKTIGSRILLIEDVGDESSTSGPVAWKQENGDDFYASANDIIEWTGSAWRIAFDASESESQTVFVTNLNTKIQYVWTGADWVESVNGYYPPGSWRLELD